MDYVFGYTAHNDVSGRTLRTGASSSEGSSMTKGMDTFSPLGPFVTLKEDVPDSHNLAIETKLNGKIFPMPNANTKYMKHRIPLAVSYLSRIMTLLPGDIISTGVPAPTAPLNAGDKVEIAIERLETLRNRVVGKFAKGQLTDRRGQMTRARSHRGPRPRAETCTAGIPGLTLARDAIDITFAAPSY